MSYCRRKSRLGRIYLCKSRLSAKYKSSSSNTLLTAAKVKPTGALRVSRLEKKKKNVDFSANLHRSYPK
jgi:cell division protein FtsI/penicillin-binding protein 2